MNTEIVLASGSFIRRQMLENAGITFSVEIARVDEEAIKAALRQENAPARDFSDTLAELKALRVSGKKPGAIVVGCDQVLEHKGEILSKPANLLAAKAQLLRLRGTKHSLFSSVVVMRDTQPIWRHTNRADLWMREFSDTFIDNYLKSTGDGILQSVGAYKLEEEGARLFSKISGDYFTILGFPLIETLNHLAETGIIEK